MKHLNLLPAILVPLMLTSVSAFTQSSIVLTNSTADSVLKGLYDPADYMATNVINHPDSIMADMKTKISADTLRAYLEKLQSFGNRNTGSDTVSSTWGIGATRRWVYGKFSEFSMANENRLLPAYLQFDLTICSETQHRNMVAVLPGMDTSDQSVIIIEGHIDSRCDNSCDISCPAYGADDNGSGSVLVLEMARVMSEYSYNHTIVFMLTIGEEQGLYGADAMADFVVQQGIAVEAVQNNDVVGGVICGTTASPPGCSPVASIDSIHFRIYSYGGFNSNHKGFARWVKLQYEELVKPTAEVKAEIEVQTLEDRVGRGGDHIPFRQKGITSLRFTSAHEHGDGNPSQAGYIDHQHTSGDSIGMDTNGDGIPDSLWVDFNYLSRNTLINATSSAMLGIGPKRPQMTATAVNAVVVVDITDQTQYDLYRIGIRTTTNDWDTIYDIAAIHDTLWNLPAGTLILQAMSVDTNGVESLPSFEVNVSVVIASEILPVNRQIELLQNHPNPFDEATFIGVRVDGNQVFGYSHAFISIVDLEGREIGKLPIQLEAGINEVVFTHGLTNGVYLYSLVIDDEVIDSKRMVFAW